MDLDDTLVAQAFATSFAPSNDLVMGVSLSSGLEILTIVEGIHQGEESANSEHIYSINLCSTAKCLVITHKYIGELPSRISMLCL